MDLIRQADLVELEKRREDLRVLKRVIETLETELLEALRAGKPVTRGGLTARITVTERKNPAWKTEALALAKDAGRDVEEFEAEVRARTKPSVSESIVIEAAETAVLTRAG